MQNQRENFEDNPRPSKTQRKKQVQALQDLGENLTQLSKETLQQFKLDENLFEAILEAKRIKSHEGKRRQMQYIGRLMRQLEENELAAITEKSDAVKGVSKTATAQLHWIEQTRQQLLAHDQALTEFITHYPHADVKVGRQLIRQSRKERDTNKSPRYFRQLFQWIKDVIENSPSS